MQLVGRTFGRLTVIGRIKEERQHRILVRCECGTERNVSEWNLRSGNTRSCGCLSREAKRRTKKTGGMAKTPTWYSWTAMMIRTTCKNSVGYQNYGGRGITVCERWREFANFFSDMGPRPDGCTLDRIDVNGDYEPGNCRWATRTEQSRNRRDLLNLTFDGRTQCLAAWADEIGMHQATLYGRLLRGWTTERAISTPVDKRYSK